jgi:hypothetical protein
MLGHLGDPISLLIAKGVYISLKFILEEIMSSKVNRNTPTHNETPLLDPDREIPNYTSTRIDRVGSGVINQTRRETIYQLDMNRWHFIPFVVTFSFGYFTCGQIASSTGLIASTMPKVAIGAQILYFVMMIVQMVWLFLSIKPIEKPAKN